jgi:hypothetical protein
MVAISRARMKHGCMVRLKFSTVRGDLDEKHPSRALEQLRHDYKSMWFLWTAYLVRFSAQAISHQ